LKGEHYGDYKVFHQTASSIDLLCPNFRDSWGGVLILGAPYGMPTTSGQFEKVWPIVFIPYFLGPSLAGLLMTGLVNGKAGFRELVSRFLKWRVGFLWYMIAILAAPLLVTLILLALSLASPVFLPAIFTTADKVGLILLGIMVGLIFGGIMEELGWTGFAVPTLRLRYNILTTGLKVGFLWGVWHFFRLSGEVVIHLEPYPSPSFCRRVYSI
jgi:membrane protease YdiL (CAAX protease family)